MDETQPEAPSADWYDEIRKAILKTAPQAPKERVWTSRELVLSVGTLGLAGLLIYRGEIDAGQQLAMVAVGSYTVGRSVVKAVGKA